jgi:hypothetical protein
MGDRDSSPRIVQYDLSIDSSSDDLRMTMTFDPYASVLADQIEHDVLPRAREQLERLLASGSITEIVAWKVERDRQYIADKEHVAHSLRTRGYV